MQVNQRRPSQKSLLTIVVSCLLLALLPSCSDESPASKKAKTKQQQESGLKMRQLGLAMHCYHDHTKFLPARFSTDSKGAPLLSWRVHILPYIDQHELYQQFHLDEAWDSPHNKTLIEKMPVEFSHPVLDLPKGETVYLAAADGSAIVKPTQDPSLERPGGMSLEAIKCGTSYAALIFEVAEENAVCWTKPEDFDWRDSTNPVRELYDGWDVYNILLANGAIATFRKDNLNQILGDLIDPLNPFQANLNAYRVPWVKFEDSN